MMENNGWDRDPVSEQLRRLMEELAALTKDNEFFNRGEKTDLVQIGKRLAEYLHDNNVRRIAFLDTSARPAYICLREAWKRLYPNEEVPEIYFINPTGFNTNETVHQFVDVGQYEPIPRVVAIAAKQLPKEEMPEFFRQMAFRRAMENVLEKTMNRTPATIQTELQKGYKKLVSDTESPLLVFDTCIHTGMSVDIVMDALRDAGMQDVRIGLASNNRNFSGFEPDFVALDGEAAGSCYPFDKDKMIEKTIDSISSKRTDDEENRERSHRLRKVIKEIINLQWNEVD
jgi:hypothetical protein